MSGAAQFHQPLLPGSGPADAKLPNRTGTDQSTMASESDQQASPWLAGNGSLQQRLEKVAEKRGWRHFVGHSMRVPITFVAGIAAGVALADTVRAGVHGGAAFGSAKVTPYESVPAPRDVPAEYMASQPLNNSCLIPNLSPVRDGPQTFDACGFVIRSTDEVWNLRGNVDDAIEKYFHEDYYNAGSWGKRGIGKKELRDAVYAEMRAFPDIQIHITDCVCRGNDDDGYKCAMPDVLTGTNLGPSAYGPATGRYARWTGMVESIVKKDPVSGLWQYVAEWGVHDEWALIQQLGLDFRRVPHPQENLEPIHDCTPLTVFAPDAQMNRFDFAIQRAHAEASK
jgi:hypothetical protein